MDVTSIEFYTLAFVVAMALVAFLIGSFDKEQPSTYILQLSTEAASEAQDVLTVETLDEGRYKFYREGLSLAPGETINLVFTIRGDNCLVVEKKGKRCRGAVADPVAGQALVKCLRYGRKYKMRYESQLTSAWASFTLDTTHPQSKRVPLNY